MGINHVSMYVRKSSHLSLSRYFNPHTLHFVSPSLTRDEFNIFITIPVTSSITIDEITHGPICNYITTIIISLCTRDAA